MPIFEHNGKKYNVKDEHIDSFKKDFPDASTIMEREGKKYRVRSADYETFLSEQTQTTKEGPADKSQYTFTEEQLGERQRGFVGPPSTAEYLGLNEPLSDKDKERMLDNIDIQKRGVQRTMDNFNERLSNMDEYRDKARLGYGYTVEGEKIYNRDNGKLEQTYITPLGNSTTNKSIADMESSIYRDTADMSISGQLRRAHRKLLDLEEQRKAAGSRAHEKAQKFGEEKLNGPLGAIIAGDVYRGQVMTDNESNALDVAINETKELIGRLEREQERQRGVDVGYWRGVGSMTAEDFDFGLSGLSRNLTKMNAGNLVKDGATEEERRAYNEMMAAQYLNEQAEEQYHDSWWYDMGVMTKEMVPFMLDFAIFKGTTSVPSFFAKGSAKLGAKVVGKEVAEKMAKEGFITYLKNNGVRGLGQYAGNYAIKALGTTFDDLIIRAPLMVNTVQLGKTSSDIIDRKLGNVVVNKDGTYDYRNNKTWGSAVWQGEANAIIETFSEMFGAHLPKVKINDIGKLANVIGAKRISNILTKADASAFSQILYGTEALFEKMGVSGYFGEVSEEYYGQMWRTMLNLDDAYIENPDGSRTNLLLTGKFHGDIWGGMGLSIGLMKAGQLGLSSVTYASMKHDVNKADVYASELLGKEVWEPLRETIDITTNEDIGALAESVLQDKELTSNDKSAIMNYMERSLMMRGFNLGTIAQKRGGKQDEDVQAMNESYIDGYNIDTPQEMTDAKNMYDYQRQRVLAIIKEDFLAVIENDPAEQLDYIRNSEYWSDEERGILLDYLNSKQVYDGMIQRVRDDIDGRIDQSNAMVNARTNRTTGMIQGATMKQDDRRVYVIAGNLVQYEDGSGIDNNASDGSIIVRDAETGALEQVSPEAVLNIDNPLNPADEKMTAAEAIRQQFAQEAADKIDGVVTFSPGDTYTITGDDAQILVQIVANDEGIVDNGDGTVNVSDGVNIFPLAKETIQQQVEEANLARVAQFEQQRAIENAERQQAMQEANRPQYAINDLVSLTDENGVTVRGSITADADADGRFEVYTEAPINGKRVNLFTRDELDNMLLEHNGVVIEQPAENEGNNSAENIGSADLTIPENGNIAPQNIPAMQRIPKDMQGNPLYEQTDSDTAWDAIVEQTEGDEAMAQTVADGMVADKEAALKKLEKAKSKGGATVAEKIAAEKERKAAIDAAQQEVNLWKKIAGTANRRRMDAEAERRRVADEAAALRKAEEERLRAEREEAERIEREVLNGVPDIVDDTPQDARARGYRRVSGHKIDRQEPLQAVQGKEVAVRFSDDAIANGRVAVIDAAQLQPSHIQGVRNPLHFIDEAQPKERNDEASVMSTRKIAGNIRPEEITSSVTAYTGAPTVNARGEAIQGNNRSDALRLMWESHQEQAAQYKQYLIDHADEFGLNADDVAAMERPVLVNMLDVDDAEAITLGQFVAQDTESGGTERIKPKNALQKMGNDMRSFANLLLKSNDEETSFAGLVDNNGVEVLKWMSQRGYITPTQYKSAFDSKGNLTAEAKNDLRGIMYQSIFKGGSTRLEEMFNAMPAKAGKAILATAFRDYDSPNADRMIEEIQNSIRAFYTLSQSEDFVNAKTFKDARLAVEGWKIQYQIDDVTGESYLPAEKFSNFALLLATMYKGENQSVIQGTFNKLYDLIQGTQEPNLFEQPDNTPRSLAQAIYETLNITYDGQQRSNVLVGDSSASQRGQQGSTGDAATGERIESGERTADSAGSIDGDSRGIRSESEDRTSQSEENATEIKPSMSANEAIDFVAAIGEQIQAAEAEVNTNPTEAQKEAGNYKKGHVQIGTFNITIEQPKGSVRSGVDKGGKKWEVEMQNTYGYIRGTEGVDGDHIDVFLSDDIDGWNGRQVFVVDQRNEDGTFDEHKVMLGFNDINDAEAAYMSNYEEGWQGLGAITGVSIEEFEKWIASSHRKTKAFAEYKSVKTTEGQSASAERRNLADFKEGDVVRDYYDKKLYRIKKHSKNGVSTIAMLDEEGNEVGTTQMNAHNNSRYSLAEAPVKAETPTISQESEQVSDQDNAPYTIAPAQYTTKKGKVLDMHLVKFAGTLTKEQQRAAKELAKADKGWYDREQGGFMMRSEESAKQLADTILNNDDAVSDAQPVSLADTRKIVGTEQQVQPTNPSGNRLVTDERYAELRERMRKKLGGQMNVGIDPEILAIGTEMAVYHLEKGARKFTEYAKAMIADLGDAIRPYLKAFYNGARNLPEVESSEIAADMTPYDEVQQFNVATFDKEHSDPFTTAEIVVAEQAHQEEAEQAKQEIINQRNTERRQEDEQTSANTEAIASQAETVADKAESDIEEATTEEEITEVEQQIDEQLNAIDEQLAKFNIDDLHSGMRVILKDGRNVLLSMVMHSGEQLSATQFSKPRVYRLYGIHNGQMVDITPADVDVDATRRLLEGNEVATPVEEETKQPKAKKSKKKAVNLQQSDELGLFDSLFDNETNNEDGLQRNDDVRTGGLQANNSGHRQGLQASTEKGSESEQQDSRGTDLGGERTGDAVDRTVRPRLSDAVTEKKNTRNNHSERGKDHAPTSVDARIEANIKAIELAKQLLESGEQATEKQMQTLRKFSGWGGLGKAFSEGTYYAPNLIAKRLRELLGEAAYQEAVMSANSAYYTPAYVVDTLWDIAEQMGFKGGNILEGSAGIGNILGQMPTHISERSNIHAIEIDGTSGGILSLLYPDAKVEIQGFEETRIANGSVDLAITNVPFVTGLRVNDTTGDKDLSKKFHNIHDFCIAKNVRKLREGGLGIFITSNGTLDNSKKLRDWIVNEGGADFVGAFRMHNKTFGGTGVTSDIIVIRKRVNGKKSANAIDVSTVTGERMAEYDTGETRKVKGQIVPVVKQLSMDYNQYFVEHPENMAGEMHFAFEKGDTFRPTSKGLYPKQDKKQEQMLAEFVQSFTAEEFGEKAADEIEVIDAMPGKKIGEVFVSDGKLYINAIGAAQPLEVNANKVKGHTKVECFEAYSAIKEALAAVLEYQITHEDDKGLKPLLAKLNKAYDDFVATYGYFNKNTAIAFLRNDVDYANVFALEKFEESADAKGNKVQKFGKTDVFSKRVIEKEAEPMPTNVKDGIVASIFKFGRVDIPYIAEQLGKSEAEVKAEIIESGYGFEDPATRQVEVSYQYLSGNVREKLRQAQENNENGEFDRNIKALQEVMPMTIPAHLIDFTLGSSWIEPKLYEEYVKERTDVGVQFTAVGGTWFMNEPYFTNYEKNRAMGVTSEMLGRTVMGHTLIEAAIQNKSITVSTVKKNWDGSTETITDKEATQACSAKIDEIRQDFKEWARQKMQSDAEMSERMERVYNDTFNNYVPMSIPDEFVPEYFGGASHKFKMRSHQGRAIVRGTMQPLLLAHEVGTGKTFTLISTAMEMRRLGTARKPMIVVQNATVGQFVASAKELYPNAKILTLEEADRSADGRKNFYAKIKYNDWDMIVVPQSTFEFIPDSEERQMAFVQEKIEEKMLVLEQMKEADPDGKSMITRQAEREIALLEEELAGLSGETGKKRTANDEKKRAVALQNAEVKAMEMLDRRTDDVENFDDMGIDALLIDEAHEYKHLGFATAMQRGVKGVDPSYSKKSQGVFLKTQAVLEKNNGRNVIFATGTPISNTAAEIWTFMRYLMPADTMKEYGIYYFDDFVRNFGNIQQMLEFTTSGKFKENNRFAGYVNLPELVRIWSGVSDTVLTKEAGGVSDKIPDMEGGKAQDLYLPQTRALRSIMKYVKAELERYDKMSGKEKKENSHIPLTMYGIAKAAAVDARLVQSDAEDDAQSKTNEAVRQTLRSLKESADYKGTVAIFADNYQNKESGFNLYEDIRTKLIAEGVPADEIVVIKSGMTVKKKLEIFEKVNRGEVRVILGSTFTLGTGVNIQERLYTLIHLDAPNRPMDYTQRNGRILRQGNLHKAMGKPVRVLRFGVEDSLDVTAYQRLKTKGAIADSIMNGKQMMASSMTNRVLEEEEDVFGDTVAQLSGSEYAMLKNNAEKNVRKYASRKKQWEADQTYIHNAKPRVKAFIKEAEKRIEDNSRYLEAVQTSFPDGKFKEIVIGKHRFATIEAMEDFFKEHNKSVLAEMKQMKDGEIAGEQKRELTIQIGGFSFKVKTLLTKETKQSGMTLFTEAHKSMTYSCPELGIEDYPVHQQLLRNAVEDIVTNVITGKDFAERLEIAERVKKHNEAELEQLLSREGKPFEYEAELEQAQTQYEEFSELMKKELAEKEAKYAEMDATVDTAANLSNTDEEDDTLYRSDEEVPRLTKHRVEKIFGGIWIDDAEEFAKFASAVNNSPFEEDGEGIAFTDNYFYAYYLNIDGQVIPFASVYLNSLESQEVVNQVKQEIKNVRKGERTEFYIDRAYVRAKNLKSQDNADNGDNNSLSSATNDGRLVRGLLRKGRYYDRPSLYVKTQRADRFGLLDEYSREGAGPLTDREVVMENDPYSKVLGKPRHYGKRQREFAARQRQRMAERVESLAKKLHLDNVEIITDASALEGKKQRAKGFYSKSTGKITIVIPNHASVLDVEQTLLHEAVAHYGLRLLFGEHFDTFLDNVFNNADEAIRQRIVALAAKNGWDFHKATEEYLAMLAENTEFKNTNASWWRQIKELFLNMLHKIGFEGFGGVTLTDNELRYILWRSYENLAEPGKYRSILGEAADVAKQYELGVGNYSDTNLNPNFAAESDDDLYRDGDPEIHERELARDRYERRVKTGMFQSQEALQDSMLGLKEAMQAILGQGTNIEDVDGFENAYLGENRLSSVNKAEADAFAHTLFKPMLDEVAKLARTEVEREELTDYMMAKHGLERNAYMRNEAIKNGATDADQTDYAGLTALTGMDDVTDAEAEAQRMVDDYEQAHDTTDLWKKVNAVSKDILQKSYDCGMMSKETFDKVSDMYEFYIPLRGFDEKTSAEAYAYLSHKHSAFNAPIKKAEGRRSKADDPFANLQSMAEGAIMQGNRNKLVKQRFLNFALNHPSDLVSVSDIWVEYDAVTDEWKPVFPDNIESTDTPEEVEQKMQDFETKMESLAQQHPDQYKRGKDAIGIPYRIVESRDMRQHQVVVKRGGRDYVITINGNPRAAQALNGQTNPDNDMSGALGAILRAGEKINRQLSAFYTTRNPDFIVSNFMRDMLYTNSMAWIKESPNYALRFHRNYLMVNPVTMKRLLAKYRKGTLDMSNRTEAMFHQFMMNGGETGYANIRDIEQHKNDIKRELKKSNGRITIQRAWDFLTELFDELNRAVENCARFAAFVTSREMGRSIDRAIYDAKEISVNFNKKGSGSKFLNATAQTRVGNASAFVSGIGRSTYVFWNAAIQGTTNFGRQMKRHPAKAFTGVAAMFLLGAIVAYLGSDDDEDDKNAYFNLPEYVRRSNILFRAGDSWISIPLPIEYRAFYGMGELMTSVLSGKEHLTGGEIAEAIAGQATQILPLDFLEGGGGWNAFVPSTFKPIVEAYVAEKSWTGLPLYKNTPFNKDMPEWTKAYKSANKHIVNLAAVLNEATGGDPYTKGAIDINPAQIEYMLNGYFGGVASTIDKLTKTAETIAGDREYDPRSFLLWNRLVKAGDERTEYRAVNRLKEEHDRLKTRLRHYEEDTDNGIFDYAEKIDFLYNSPEYERYEIFEDYRRDIDDLYDELQEAVDDEERKDIEAELNELKKEMIQEMNTTRKRK